jgi:uncharacterized protein
MFWDSSAIVPLILPERRSIELASAAKGDAEFTTWWATPLECLSAIHRRHREAPLSPVLLAQAVERVVGIKQDGDTILPTDHVRSRAERLVATHPLRAADALQLAAALAWCEESPSGETFVCLDERLRDAARREGFLLLPGG